MKDKRPSVVVIVDTDEKQKFLTGNVPDALIISLEKHLEYWNVCRKELYDDLLQYKEIVKSSKSVYASSADYIANDTAFYLCLSTIGVVSYFSFDYDVVNRADFVSSAIQNATLVTENELKARYANMKISIFFKCNISKILQWYLDKENLADAKDISKISISYPAILSLKFICDTEEEIESFIPEEFERVSIVYQYGGVQFEAHNRLRFKQKDKDELEAFIMRVSNVNNRHIVKKYTREQKNIKPPKLVTTLEMERIGVTVFRQSIEDTHKIIEELRSGNIQIDGYKGPLITSAKTRSTKISASIVPKILELINSKFGDTVIATDYSHLICEGESEKEAIRPLYFESNFMPSNIRKHLTEDQYKVYSFLFHRTVAAFMKDAIVDYSEVVMDVEGNEFKSFFSKILQDDTGNEYQGWTRLGPLLASYEYDMLSENQEIPSRLTKSQELFKKDGEVLDTRTHVSHERNPKRFGEGRLKNYLVSNGVLPELSSFDAIKHIKEQDLARSSSGVMIPTALGRLVHYVLKENAPWLFDDEFIEFYVDSIESVLSGDLEEEAVLEGFYLKEYDFKKKLGIRDSDSSISQDWLVNRAKSIAKKINVQLSEEILRNRKLLMEFVNANDPDSENLGKCPSCKKGGIHEKEKGFFCDNMECRFVVWKSNMLGFFEYFQKHINERDLKDIVKIILSKKKCLVDNLVNPKDENAKRMNVNITFGFNEKYKRWGVEFYKPKKQKPSKEQEIAPQTPDSSSDGHAQEETKEQKERRLLMEKAYKDQLTRAYNRYKMEEDISNIFKKGKHAVAFFDIDNFKSVNDTYGHKVGDDILRALSDSIHDSIRGIKNCYFYRYNGEEFCLVVASESADNHRSIVEEVFNNIKNIACDNGQGSRIGITVSVGVAYCDDGDFEKTISEADSFVYAAKESGKNQIVYNDSKAVQSKNNQDKSNDALLQYVGKDVIIIMTEDEAICNDSSFVMAQEKTYIAIKKIREVSEIMSTVKFASILSVKDFKIALMEKYLVLLEEMEDMSIMNGSPEYRDFTEKEVL